MGNPHAVYFTTRPVADFPLHEIGPKVEHNPIFPQRTNFEVARVLSRGKIEARVWERGAGETLASGSSACAVAATAVRLGLARAGDVTVAMPGGDALVHVSDDYLLRLRAPAQIVFECEVQPGLVAWLGAS